MRVTAVIFSWRVIGDGRLLPSPISRARRGRGRINVRANCGKPSDGIRPRNAGSPGGSPYLIDWRTNVWWRLDFCGLDVVCIVSVAAVSSETVIGCIVVGDVWVWIRIGIGV